MKKIFKTFIFIFMMMLSCSCVKDETVMTINRDKSVDLVINVGYPISGDKTLSIDEIKSKVGNDGFFIDSYHDEKYSGYSLSKKYKNINKISSKKEKNINLAEFINGKFDDSQLFTVKKGFFKNIYTANYTYNFTNIYDYNIEVNFYGSEDDQNSIELYNYIDNLYKDNNNVTINKNDIYSDFEKYSNFVNDLKNKNIEYKGLPAVIIDEQIYFLNSDETKSNIKEYIDSKINKNDYELTYKVNLPFKVLTSNNNDKNGNTLIWNCNYFDENKIQYSFEIFNISSIIIIIVITLIFVGIIILSSVSYKKIQKDKKKFMSKNTDLSSITPNLNDDSNTIASLNDLMKK